MGKVIGFEARLWDKRCAQAGAEIVQIQNRVEAAIKDSDDPTMAVYALLAAALCIAPDKGTNEDWRSMVEDAFHECCAIIKID